MADLLLAAARGQNGGAARLWHLARHCSPGGSGYIPSKALRRFVLHELEVKRGVYDIWLSRALAIGLLSRQGADIKITAAKHAAVILGVEKVKRPADIPIKVLVNKGWVAWVWATWLKVEGLEGHPISRAAMRGMSGIVERSQRDYERTAGVVNRPNYALDNTRKGWAGMVEYVREFEDRGAFPIGDQLAWRLPNSREVINDSIKVRGVGRTRRINAAIADLLNNAGRDLQVAAARRYCQCDKQVKKAQKVAMRLARKGKQAPDWLYQISDRSGFWHAIPA